MSQPPSPLPGATPGSTAPVGANSGVPQNTAVLPDKIPDGWLEQIKSALKPSWWAVILGSSLVGTVIGSGVSLYTAMKTNEANRQLEQLKSGLELQKEAVRSRAAAYTKLAQSVNVLAMKLEGFEDLVQIAQRSSMTASSTVRIQEQLQAAGLAAREVIIARYDPVLSGSDLAREVDESMKELSPTLAAAKEDPVGSLPRIKSAIEQIRPLIPRIQGQTLKEIEGIH